MIEVNNDDEGIEISMRGKGMGLLLLVIDYLNDIITIKNLYKKIMAISLLYSILIHNNV